ncbi:glycoside hydrolase [Effusibacillus dendaii]|uniref:GH18 domain-containing protein n=1 Tax=Effusibacillus dendaii TaxID=2743772 RepID=A0A7I8DD38_9BACL|nr:glycoside hydrolase [Effusibacillus dendaii]BCJ86859.1 hypothetical protein skT53_18440 [Effusibacillus dendaii]
MEDHQSLYYKLDLVARYDIRGIGIWRLGLEDAPFRDTIANWQK